MKSCPFIWTFIYILGKIIWKLKRFHKTQTFFTYVTQFYFVRVQQQSYQLPATQPDRHKKVMITFPRTSVPHTRVSGVSDALKYYFIQKKIYINLVCKVHNAISNKSCSRRVHLWSVLSVLLCIPNVRGACRSNIYIYKLFYLWIQ